MNYKSVTGKNWLFKQYDEKYAKKYTKHFTLVKFYLKLFQ
jgi:hypothetical protein